VGSIVPFLRNASFQPEELKVMSEAFDSASLFVTNAESLEMLAVRIITIAGNGERDATKLTAAALAGFCSGVHMKP